MSQAFNFFLKKMAFDFPPHCTSTSSQCLHMNCSSSNRDEQEQQTALKASPEFSSHNLCLSYLYQKYLSCTFYNRVLPSPILIRLVELFCDPVIHSSFSPPATKTPLPEETKALTRSF